MKRYIFSSIIALGGVMTLNAQSAYDAETMTNTDLNGTARYVGMGGALGALGADLSTMGSNPAGTGLMRKSDFSISFGGVFTGNKGTLNHDAGRASLDQAGVLFALGGDNGSVKNINFGVNYQKRRNFLSNLDVDLNLNRGSQTFQLAQMADEAYSNGMEFGTLTYATIPIARKFDKSEVANINDVRNEIKNNCKYEQGVLWDNYQEYMIGDDKTPLSYADYEKKYEAYDKGNAPGYGYYGTSADESNYRRATYGNNSQVDINISTNINDKLFLGLSVGIYTMSYDRQTAYFEKGVDGNGYQIDNWYHSANDGIDVKLGAIFRPFDDSPFRIGFTVHTPIWYNIKENSTIYVDATNYNENASFEYRFRTPWKFNFSLGHTFDNIFALGVEYELQDLASCKYYNRPGDNLDFASSNDDLKANLTTQHTLKIGAEIKPSQEWSIRLGYNLVTAGIKKDAYSSPGYNSAYTETDYTNWGATNRLTFGLGYRFKGGYFDLAYQLQLQKGKFYAYDYEGVNHTKVSDMTINPVITPTEITNNRSHIMATLGFKF